MSQAEACPICEQALGSFWGLEYKGHTIVRCTGCGLRYVSPRQADGADHANYDDAAYFASTARGQISFDGVDLALKTCSGLIRSILAHSPRPDPTLLDVGTGTGFFAKVAKLVGFRHVVGADLTDVNRLQLAAFGIPLIVGDVTALPPAQVLQHAEGAPGFEVISATHVLEHVADPNAFLQGLRRLLVPAGLLYLVLPNEGSLPSAFKSFASAVGLKKRAYKHLSPGHHLFFYTRGTLVRLLEKNGFAILQAGTRAGEKRRGPLGRAIHRIADALHSGTWLEVVARRGP